MGCLRVGHVTGRAPVGTILEDSRPHCPEISNPLTPIDRNRIPSALKVEAE